MANKIINPQKESSDIIIRIQTNKKTKLFTTFKENTNLITAPTSTMFPNQNNISKPIFKTIIENKNEAKSKFRRDHSTNRVITFLSSFFRKYINNYIKENNLNNIDELKLLDGTQGKEHKNKLIVDLLNKNLADFLSAEISKKNGANFSVDHNENIVESILGLKNNDLSRLLNIKLIKLIHHFSWEKKKIIKGRFFHKLKKKFIEDFNKKFGKDIKYGKHLKNHMKYIEVYYSIRIKNQIQKSIWIRNKKRKLKIQEFIQNYKKRNNNIVNFVINDIQCDFNLYNNYDIFEYSQVDNDNANIIPEQNENQSIENDNQSNSFSGYNNFISDEDNEIYN